MQDEMIVALYWKIDEKAISETERKYGRYLSKIAYNILSDWEDSKETVNDTYLKAWNSMPTHKPGVLSTYLGKITRQLSIDAFRTRNRDKRKHSEYAVSLSGAGGLYFRQRNHGAERRIETACGSNQYLSLHAPSRSTKHICWQILLCGFYPRSRRLLRRKRAKVKSMLYRTRQGLKKYLEKEGYEL